MKNDVAVVGGSAAGFLTARLLARAGLPVRVYEAADSLAPASRTLIVTARMRSVLGPLGEESVINQIRQFELFADGRMATVSLTHPDLVIERAKLIHALAEQAQAAGTQVLLGQRLRGLKPDQKGVTLLLQRDSKSEVEREWARIVIGADGTASKVRQAAGWSKQSTVPLVQAVVRLPQDLPANTVRVWFVPEDTPYFYWLIPESGTHGALGLIGLEGRKTQRCLELFLEKRGLTPVSFQAARIPVYSRGSSVHRRIGQGDVYLVGDAAGQVKMSTVGGVVTGFRGACAVAESILNGGTSLDLVSLRRELDLHLLLRKALHGFTQTDYSALLDMLNSSARALLGRYTRDEAGKLLWRLALRQPRLLLLAFRALLAGGSEPCRTASPEEG